MSAPIYIGIDNGLTGGLVALSSHPGPPIAMKAMPTRGKAKGNELDAEAVHDWISYHTGIQRVTVVIETPMTGWGGHNKDGEGRQFKVSSQSIASMWDSYGALRSMCEIMKWRHHRITPKAWQTIMLPGCAKGNTKPAALARCRQLWPEETWLATDRSSKPHEGMIDAALISEYARKSNL